MLIVLKTKCYIHHHDILGSILKAMASFLGIVIMSFAITKGNLVVNASIIAVAEFLGSLTATRLFDKILEKNTKDKTRKYKVYFNTLQECLECYLQLHEEGIKVFKNEETKKLTIYSHTKDDSRFIRDTIEDSYEGLEVLPIIKKV